MGAVIVEAVRSAVGKRKGGLAGVHRAPTARSERSGSASSPMSPDVCRTR